MDEVVVIAGWVPISQDMADDIKMLGKAMAAAKPMSQEEWNAWLAEGEEVDEW